MEQHEVSDTNSDEADERPLWLPTVPPEPESWSVGRVFERFGFLLALLGVGLVFGLIYLNADWLLREPASRQVAEAPAARAATPTVSAASQSAVLTVISIPAGARVVIDGSDVGETPLIGHSLEKGTRVVSVQKEAFSTQDTLIHLQAERTILQFTLHTAGPDAEAITEDLAATTEAVPDLVKPPLSEQAPTTPTTQPKSATKPLPATTTSTNDDDEAAAEEEEEAAPDPEPAPPGALQITSQPSGATVWVDGDEVGVTPVRVSEVGVGSHPVSIQMEGFKAFAATVTIESGERTSLNGRLEEIEMVEKGMASVRILVKPWGNIYIDGELSKRESTIWYTAQLQPGEHRIRVEHPALGKWEHTVDVSATANDDIIVDFNKGEQP